MSVEQDRFLVGIDEVGRGCLAGPVWACAYVFRVPGTVVKYLKDSKKVSVSRREKLVPELESLGWFGHGFIRADGVDAMGIGVATFAAMRLAVLALQESMGVPFERLDVVIDGNQLPKNWGDLGLGNLSCMVKADDKVSAVSAASILAKVARDKIMADMDALHPGYNFGKHVGYGSPEHLGALKELGPCGMHRMSFEPMKSMRSASLSTG